MKIIIMSDSHGNYENIRYVMSLHRDADYAFFLGDGINDFERAEKTFRDTVFYSVRGNNDFMTEAPIHREIVLCGRRILMLHGHSAGVKYGYDTLISMAENRSCEIVLFGHTHNSYYEYVKRENGGIHLFNPGSVGLGGYRNNTFGILTLDEKNILFSVGVVP